MILLLTFFSILHIIHCSCPDGFELVRDGECRGIYTTVNIKLDVAIDTLISKCAEVQGQPVIIHNDEHNSYWVSRSTDNGSGTSDRPLLPLGLRCNSNSKNWEWVDGSSVDFKPANDQYPSDLDEQCTDGVAFHIMHDGSWGRWANGMDTFYTNIGCTTQLHQPILSTDGCDSFEDDSEDGVCYQVGAAAKSWQEAQLICSKLGANLASIHNLQENSFIRRLAVSNGAVDGVFLGATMSGKGKDFGWIDGTDWDYQNFHSGFPIPGAGDCLAMDTSTSSGQWMNMDCNAQLPAACIRDQKPVVEPTCSDGPWEEGKLITSPGFPYNSSVPCDFFLVVDAGMKIEVEIVYLEANSCCDSLAIHDGYLGGQVLANLTGEVQNDGAHSYNSTSNTMKVSWQPNGGVNVRGMAMVYYAV